MACNNRDCDCLDRVVQYLEEQEIHYAERALKMAKLPNRARAVLKLKTASEAYGNMLAKLKDIVCNIQPPPPKPPGMVSRMVSKIFA